jgi:hypothetical protein
MMEDIVVRVGGSTAFALVVICVAGILTTAKFIFDYMRASGMRWWCDADGRPNHAGRFLMISRINLLVLLAVVVINRWFDAWPGRDAITLFLIMSFIVQATVWPNYILRMQAAEENER